MTDSRSPDGLTAEQVDVLRKPLARQRVAVLDGQSHLEAWDVRAHMIRVFGYAGWSADLIGLQMLYEEETTLKNGKPGYAVAYRATVQVTIHATGATYTEAAVNDAKMPDYKRGDAHDFAVKGAESQAFKRCCANLGTQFGLSLYDDGRTDDVVRVLASDPQASNDDAQQVQVGSDHEDAQ